MNNKSVVLFVVLDQFANWEFAHLAAALNSDSEQGTETQYKVKTVSLSREPLQSIGGLRVIPDEIIASVRDDYTGLVLIGGNSWRNQEAKKVLPLVQNALKRNVPLGAICDATTFLAATGFLNDKKHTGNSLESLQIVGGEAYRGSALYQQQPAIRDGNLVTANGTAFLEFAREMMIALDAFPLEEITMWYDFNKWACMRQ